MSDPTETIEARMRSGEPFTFADVWVPATGGNHSHPNYRLADRLIQKWRRNHWIEMRPGQVRGRSPLWFYVGGEPTK